MNRTQINAAWCEFQNAKSTAKITRDSALEVAATVEQRAAAWAQYDSTLNAAKYKFNHIK